MSSFLPPEIITNILSRLPVKPLLRFRCVSKPWCSLIDSPDFVKLHLNQSLNTKSNRNLLLGFKNFTAHSVELRSIDSPGVDSIDSTQRLKTPLSDSILSSSCYGLCLGYVQLEDPIHYIWNPFTRKYKELPPNPFASESLFSINPELGIVIDEYERLGFKVVEHVKCGFAYVSEADEYKVVQVIEFKGSDLSYFGNEACILSLRSNEWERLEPFPYQLKLKRVWGAHLNGALHTVVHNGSSPWALMVFNTRTKQHSILPKPRFDRRYVVVTDITVEVFEGNICLLVEQPKNLLDVQIDIWVMKDYGVKDSWFKLLSVALEPHSVLSVYPLVYSENGDEVLIICKFQKLVWFNLRDKSMRKVTVNVLPFDFYAEVSFESLVSLPGFINMDNDKAESQDSGNISLTKNTSLTKGFLSQGFKLKL